MHPLKKYSIDNNIKIKEIAEKTKTKPVYISQIIMGYRKPSPRLAKLLEQETGISRIIFLYPENKKGTGGN